MFKLENINRQLGGPNKIGNQIGIILSLVTPNSIVQVDEEKEKNFDEHNKAAKQVLEGVYTIHIIQEERNDKIANSLAICY